MPRPKVAACSMVFRLTFAILLVASPLLSQAPGDPQKLESAQRYYKENTKFSFETTPLKKGGPVKWTTSRQELVKDEFAILEGDVRITYQDIVLSADKVTFNLKTKDAAAEGHVIIDQGPRRLSADRAVFNLDSKTGTLFNATGAFDPSIYFTGEKIEKLDEKTYRLTEGVFTSCDLDKPSWSFHLGSGVITLDDYARLKDLSFRAGRVPLFWSPYIVWPTKRDRSKGFLIPRIGYSNQFGAYLGTSYFIPFGESYDATVYADLFSKKFLGTGADFRYAPTVETKGKFTGYIVRDPSPDPLSGEADKLRWKYFYKHTQEDLPGGFRGVVDVQDFSDLNFFQRYERNFQLNTLSSIYSSAYLTKNRPNYSFNVRAERRKHFLGPETTRVFEQLPSVELRGYPNQLGQTPFYLSFESSAAQLRADPGKGYFRADLYPAVTMKLKTPQWLSVKPRLALRQTYYTASIDPATGTIADDSISRSSAQGELEVVGPSLSRVVTREIGGFAKFKHVIEPRVRYLYNSDDDDQRRIINFDSVDSPFFAQIRDGVEYSLTQRLIGKEKGENASSREILSIALKQTVALSDRFESFTPAGKVEQRFTPLTLTTHFNPYQSVSADSNLVFSSRSQRLDQASVSGNIVSDRLKSYLNFTWFSSFASPENGQLDSSQFRFTTGAPLWRDKVRGDFQVNFDAEKQELQEQRTVIGFYASCYTISFEYRDFLGVGRSARLGDRNRDYQISVSLKNVGTFVDLRGSLDSLF